MGRTSIQWCDHSINPFRARNKATGKVGHFCVKISAGCRGCYSSKMQNPFLTQLEFIATNRPKVDLFIEERALDEVWSRKKPTRYFWCDMTDMFLEDYPDEWIAQCFAVMAVTHWHTHLVLTKRAERLCSLLNSEQFRDEVQMYIDVMAMDLVNPHERRSGDLRATAPDVLDGYWPLPNVHVGVSVEDETNQKARVPLLQRTPAARRFISQEPQIGPIHWDDESLTGISQVIVGGESGPKARPFNLRWAYATIAACSLRGISCFIKQLGRFPGVPSCASFDCTHPDCDITWLKLKDKTHGGDIEEWPEQLRVREFPA